MFPSLTFGLSFPLSVISSNLNSSVTTRRRLFSAGQQTASTTEAKEDEKEEEEEATRRARNLNGIESTLIDSIICSMNGSNDG